MTYDGYQLLCEQDFQVGAGGAVQLRHAQTAQIERSAASVPEIEPHWEPGKVVWVRHVDARGPYWRSMG